MRLAVASVSSEVLANGSLGIVPFDLGGKATAKVRHSFGAPLFVERECSLLALIILSVIFWLTSRFKNILDQGWPIAMDGSTNHCQLNFNDPSCAIAESCPLSLAPRMQA